MFLLILVQKLIIIPMKSRTINLKFNCVFICLIALLLNIKDSCYAGTGDTTVVQTLRFDTTMRAGVFHFPDDASKTYEKIVMRYSMRCKNGLVSTGTNRNLGCGEWDYNCYTYIVDSTQMDSLQLTHGTFSISNVTDSIYLFTTQPVYDYYATTQQEVIHDSILSETMARPPYDATLVCGVFAGNQQSALSRSQFIWTAAELTAAGLIAGPINGLEFQIPATGTTLYQLSIKLKATTADSLNDYQPDLAGLTQVYFLNTPFSNTGVKRFNFNQDFMWDGVSNILVDISWTLPLGNTSSNCITGSSSFASNGKPGIATSAEDAYLNFQANGNRIQLDTSGLGFISNEITIAFWSRGDSIRLPDNTTMLYGTDNNNTRQVNVHLPWSDSNVYWDCGGSNGSFDRINVAVSPSDYKGRWTFWAFTRTLQQAP